MQITAVTAYSNCATYTVEKVQLSNDFLKTVAAIDLMGILAKSTFTLKEHCYLTSAGDCQECFVINRLK